MRFIDLFAGLGGFHVALQQLNHECIFASEIDPELRKLYLKNFPNMVGKVHGDIRLSKNLVPPHDVLCGGFPCQPFSKSGPQLGFADRTRGTLFHDILDIVVTHKPSFILLENVGNFERHDAGKTWLTVKGALGEQGYSVYGTEHKATGGHGLVSPHHLGFPHTRERFLIIASQVPLEFDPFPARNNKIRTSLNDIVQKSESLSPVDQAETKLSLHYVECINHWNELLKAIPKNIELPSFPIWSDEFRARYPYKGTTPSRLTVEKLQNILRLSDKKRYKKKELLARLPAYARDDSVHFAKWKEEFIRKNRQWFTRIQKYVKPGWLRKLRSFPPSLRKLEWNCKGEERDLWRFVLQFRPSGLRSKRYSASPALVAMTVSQIPILGPQRRFITRVEGLRLQGFPASHKLPASRTDAFRALGNAVHVEVIKAIAQKTIGKEEQRLVA